MRVNTTDLQNAFGKYLALVEKEEIIVVKNGKSVAKLIKYTDPEHLLVHEEAKGYKSFRKCSYREYMDLVESSEQRYELIDGEIYLLAAPSYDHQVVVNEIAGRFYNFFKDRPCRSLTAPIDVRLYGHASKFEEDPNVVQPDIIVVCDEEEVEDGKYYGVPTLVVEVASPSTRGKDMVAKLNLYMRSGVREYWVVDLKTKHLLQYSFTLERDVEIVETHKGGASVTSVAFTGLEVPLHEIFVV